MSSHDQPDERATRARRIQLTTLDQRIAACLVCRDRNRVLLTKPPVMDRGHPGARIFAIGEAPGSAAAEQGRAFAGRSFGNLLKQFRAAGFAGDEEALRDVMYLTSVVKCVPAAPTPQALRTMGTQCLRFLWEQLDAVRPQYVLVFGRNVFDLLDVRGEFQTAFGQTMRTPDLFDDMFPPTAADVRWIVMPHPSPSSRLWNDAELVQRVRGALHRCLSDLALPRLDRPA